jgi:hypothetical protein
MPADPRIQIVRVAEDVRCLRRREINGYHPTRDRSDVSRLTTRRE